MGDQIMTPTIVRTSLPKTSYSEYTKRSGPWTRIDGWNAEGAFTALARINAVHKKCGISGNIGEIGVHHGQLFIALALLAEATSDVTEKIVAIDVFDNQERNVDHSGCGSYRVFKNNVRALLGEEFVRNRLSTMQGDSLLLEPQNLIANVCSIRGALGFRLFSIDGGHTVVHVLNDLRLIERVMVPGGVVVLDDFLHPKWPGVTEGAHIYCTDRASRLAPFAYGNNKMYLTTFDKVDQFREAFVADDTIIADTGPVTLYGRPMHWVDFKGGQQ